MQVNPREHATILASLRLFQVALHQALPLPEGIPDIASNGERVQPLTLDEIDALCERINVVEAEPSLTIPDSMWELTGSVGDGPPTEPEDTKESRLLVCINVNGCPLHLEAWEVKDVPLEGESAELGLTRQTAFNSYFEDDVEGMQDRQETDFLECEIMGRQYVLCATPYGR